MQEKYYTIKEVADLFKVTTTTVRNWIFYQDKLKAYKIGDTIRIAENDLKDFKKVAK